MPVYKNTSASRVVIGADAVEVGQSKTTYGFVNHTALGITKVSNLPAYNPIIHSEKVSAAKTISIPQTAHRFMVYFFIQSGEPIIRFSDNANNPALLLHPGATWTYKFFERMINDIRISGSGFVMWVIIEHI